MVDAGESGTNETQAPEFQSAERKLNVGTEPGAIVLMSRTSVLRLVPNEPPGATPRAIGATNSRYVLAEMIEFCFKSPSRSTLFEKRAEAYAKRNGNVMDNRRA
jgi:hypothetical protein